MAQELNVDIKVTGLSDLRSQLKAAKDDVIALQSSDIIDQKKLSEAIQRAGSLKDALNDANEQIKVMSGGSDFEKISNGLGLIGSQLRDMDFEGAANSAKLLTGTIKSMDPKAIADGFKDFAKTIGQLGNAFFQMGLKLLANPIFLLIAVVGAIVIAIVLLKDKVKILGDAFDLMMKPISILIQGLKDLGDTLGLTKFAQEEAAKAAEDSAARQLAAAKKFSSDIDDEYTYQINLLKARGKDTFNEEVKQQLTRKVAAEESFNKLDSIYQEKERSLNETIDKVRKERIAAGVTGEAIAAQTRIDARVIEARTDESGLLGFACFRLNGQGEKPEEYVAMLRLGDLVELLRAAGYEKRTDVVQESQIRRCSQCGEWTINDPCNWCEAQ